MRNNRMTLRKNTQKSNNALVESIMNRIKPIVKKALTENIGVEEPEMSEISEMLEEYYKNEWLEQHRGDSQPLAYLAAIVMGDVDSQHFDKEDMAFDLAKLVADDYAKLTHEPYNDEVFVQTLKSYILENAERHLRTYIEYNVY